MNVMTSSEQNQVRYHAAMVWSCIQLRVDPYRLPGFLVVYTGELGKMIIRLARQEERAWPGMVQCEVNITILLKMWQRYFAG